MSHFIGVSMSSGSPKQWKNKKYYTIIETRPGHNHAEHASTWPVTNAVITLTRRYDTLEQEALVFTIGTPKTVPKQ
jgi:hypothetical protein